jgi:hypothetical protein
MAEQTTHNRNLKRGQGGGGGGGREGGEKRE